MKKILIPICALTLVFMAAPMAFATSSSQSETTISIGNTSFEYDASPNVGVEIVSTATAYAVSTANMLTGADLENGMEYATLSTSTGYAQRDKQTDSNAGPTAPADENSLPSGGDWTWMGGDGAGS